MRKLSTLGTFVIIMFGTAQSFADDPAAKNKEKGQQRSGAMMEPKKPGPETRALLPIAADMTWTGKMMHTDATREGTQEMRTQGKADCKWSVDNLWLSCDVQSTAGQGGEAKTMRGRADIGYDYQAQEYRATMINNMGSAMLMTGQIEGNKLSLTSALPQMIDGEPCKNRLTWDWSNPNAIKFTVEQSKGNEGFRLIEEASMRPTKKEPLPGPTA